MTISTPTISVLIPTYNRKKFVTSCLTSVLQAATDNTEVVVVDNGSTDGTIEEIDALFPSVKVIRAKTNLGVAAGRNLGAKNSLGEYLLFLDHDTTVNDRIFTDLYKVLQLDSSVGLVGPLVYYFDDPLRVWGAGTSVNLTTGKVSFNKTGEIDKGDTEYSLEVDVLPTAFMVKRETFVKIGGFDEQFFAHYEDADFSFRVRGLGLRVTCISKAKVWHKVPINKDISEERVLAASFYVARNRILFMRKHSKRFPAFLILFLPVLTTYWGLQAICRGRHDWFSNVIRGTVAGLSIAISKRT